MEVFAIKNMTFAYAGSDRTVLKNINLKINEGKMVTICGKSGSGKSTLLRNLKPALIPHGNIQGKVLFNGVPIDELSHEIQTAKIGYVLQNPDSQIVTDKVWHELAFGLESLGIESETIRLRVAEMASYFGIQKWFHKDVKMLSGGQKQLLNLASVMAMQPDVLILDEPTSQLDPISAGEFLDTIKRINTDLGTTIIITEHRLESVVPMSDRVVVMDDGRIIADDTPANVGALLAAKNHSMFMAMPTPMQAYGRLYQENIQTELDCPIDVREGRKWLTSLLDGKELNFESLPEREFAAGSETVVEMKDVWFRYGKNEEDVVKDLSLKVRKGEMFCIVGGNGVGKTTALNLMSGIRKPYRGTVSIKESVSMLPQNPQSIFVEKTLKRDLLEVFEGRFVAHEERKQRILEITKLLEIDHLLQIHPYDLSGGEQQRAALAKVLLLEPKVLLMDEPTKGLDAGFKFKLADILKKLKERGITMIIVSHDIEFCSRYADTCAMFFDGKVIASGTPRRFFSGNSFYTTAANIMSRHIFKNAVNVDDFVELVKKNFDGDTCCGSDNNSVDGISNSVNLRSLNYDDFDDLNDSVSEKPDTLSVREITNPEESAKSKPRSKINLLVIDLITIALGAATILAGMFVFNNQKYFIVSMLLAIYSLIPFFARFEHRRPKARELVLLAVMITVGVAGRAAFFMVPNFKPLLAIVIISGISLGRQAGFLVGAMSAFISNFIFGQGPWTTWQILATAIIGYFAGVIFSRYSGRLKIIPVVIYGAISAFFVYGAITDLWTIFMMTSEPSLKTAIVVYTAALPFNAMHAVATVVFLLLLAKPMIEKLDRVKVKYGMKIYSDN